MNDRQFNCMLRAAGCRTERQPASIKHFFFIPCLYFFFFLEGVGGRLTQQHTYIFIVVLLKWSKKKEVERNL